MKFNSFQRFKGLFLVLWATLLCTSAAWAQKETEAVDKYRVVYEYKAPQFENGGTEGNTLPTQVNVSPDSMKVYYDYDGKLVRLIELHKRANSSTVEGKGYRIQIYAGSKMEIANETKTDFLQSFRESGMEVYKDWNPPHFWVRVGDFLSRNEAMRHLASVKTVFPDAFVVADKINLPKYKKAASHGGSEHREGHEGQQN
jgi:SPOR domain